MTVPDTYRTKNQNDDQVEERDGDWAEYRCICFNQFVVARVQQVQDDYPIHDATNNKCNHQH